MQRNLLRQVLCNRKRRKKGNLSKRIDYIKCLIGRRRKHEGKRR